MKIARVFACIFACIGSVLLLGSMGFFLLNRNADVRIRKLPQEAVSVSENFVQALNEGDLETAAQLIYGQPDLGAAGTPEDPETAAVWNAFLGSISFEYTGKLSAADSGLVRAASVVTLDIASVTEKLPERAQALVNQKIVSAESLTDVYDETGSFREELVTEILRQALEQALTQDAQTLTREVTVKLINRD
jgi:hypothetical protein